MSINGSVDSEVSCSAQKKVFSSTFVSNFWQTCLFCVNKR